jgi:hypothetical protein
MEGVFTDTTIQTLNSSQRTSCYLFTTVESNQANGVLEQQRRGREFSGREGDKKTRTTGMLNVEKI